MNILFILNFLTAIVAFVVLCRKKHFLFASVALFCIILYGYGIWHAGINIDDKLCQMLHDEECYGREKAYPAALGGWMALLLSNICLILYPWLKRWAVVIWMLMIVAVGLGVSIYSPLNIIEALYAVCCAMMSEIAVMTGQTYLAICTLENIYLHSLLPTIFALPALWVSIRTLKGKLQHKYLPLLLSGLWFALNLFMTITVWQHYINLPLEEAGHQCVGELKALAGNAWSDYVNINVMIFVVAFLIDVIISWLLYRYSKRFSSNNQKKEL